MADAPQPRLRRSLNLGRFVRPAIGVLVIAFVAWRLYQVLFVERAYGPDTWVRFAISGIILGGVYAVIALGYTLIYGILFMINFAHGDVMMLGTFAGYFTLEAFRALAATRRVTWLLWPKMTAIISSMPAAMLMLTRASTSVNPQNVPVLQVLPFIARPSPKALHTDLCQERRRPLVLHRPRVQPAPCIAASQSPPQSNSTTNPICRLQVFGGLTPR